MVYPVKDYAITFQFAGVFKSTKTIIRMGQKNQLPSNHRLLKVGRNYAIEVKNDFTELFK